MRGFLAWLFGPLLRWLWPRLEGVGDDGQPDELDADELEYPDEGEGPA